MTARHTDQAVGGAIPARAGIGLRAEHYREVEATLPDVACLEAHSENYFGAGGPPLDTLERLGRHYPLSLHGVGLSLGSVEGPSDDHIAKLRVLVERVQPALVSDHLAWCEVDGRYLNELLPLPYVEESLALVCRNVQQVQEALGRRILVENVSSYVQWRDSTIPEWAFLGEVADRTGCGLLLDVNNLYVNARNHGWDTQRYLAGLPDAVAEMHLAGYEEQGALLVDTHGRLVTQAVWKLYEEAVQRFGPVPTVIEWDVDVPPLPVLLAEARKADRILEAHGDARVA